MTATGLSDHDLAMMVPPPPTGFFDRSPIVDRLLVDRDLMARVDRGYEEAERGEGISLEELDRRLALKETMEDESPALSPGDLTAIRSYHVRVASPMVDDYCAAEGYRVLWPCDAMRLLRHLDTVATTVKETRS